MTHRRFADVFSNLRIEACAGRMGLGVTWFKGTADLLVSIRVIRIDVDVPSISMTSQNIDRTIELVIPLWRSTTKMIHVIEYLGA